MKKLTRVTQEIITNKYIFALLSIGLVFFWLFSSILLVNGISFSVLTYSNKNAIRDQNPDNSLYKNATFRGEFKSKDNNLGIVFLKFDRYRKPEYAKEDILVFKIKQKGKGMWYSSQEYRSGAFENQALFPFGFPQIQNSKDVVYQFELTSKLGNDQNFLKLKDISSFITGHKYSKSEIVRNTSSAKDFFIKKTTTSLSDVNFLLKSTIYLLPLVLLSLLFLMIKQPTVMKKYFKLLALPLILIDIFAFPVEYPGIIFIGLFAWIATIFLYKLESNVSFILSFCLVFFWILILPLEFANLENKLNIWVYLLFATGVFQSIIEERIRIKNSLNYKQFIRLLFR